MIIPLRTEFLTLHPSTALWFKQREQCEQCVHVSRPKGGDPRVPYTMMHCTAVAHGTNDATCLSARGKGAGRCGPEGKFFEARSCVAG